MVQEKHQGTLQPEQWPSTGKIEFKSVSLRYRANTELVLKGVSFVVSQGMKVGIVGRTGAGKSTISQTVSRLLELESGSIEIDGVDISKVDLKLLRQNITMVP